MKRRGWYILIVVCTSSVVFGQDFKTAVAEARTVYEKTEQLHAVVSVQAFENSHSGTPYFYQKGEIKRDHLKYFYTFGANEMVMNDDYLIVVDKDAKEISLSKIDQKAARTFVNDPLKSSFDSLARYFEKPVYKGRELAMDHYSISPKKGYLKKVDIFFNVSSKMIQKIEYQYSDEQLAIVEFLKMETKPSFDDIIFSENQYVIMGQNKTVVPSKRFKGYHVSQVGK